MRRDRLARIVYLVVFGIAATASGDEFERIEGEALATIPRSKDATPHQQLMLREIDSLPTVLRDSRSTFLVAKTDQGNYTRMLVSQALRKAPGGTGTPIAVFVLERFDTFEAGNVGTRLARGKDLILFDGFQVDLDSGQVVPDGQGGDLLFLAAKKDGPRLAALGSAKLYTLARPPANAATEGTRPSIGRSVVPTDFSGRYRFFSNGQWSGLLELKVDAEGVVSGRFRSDLNGTTYPINGEVAPRTPQRITFTIVYPRTRQEVDGLLWTEGKGAMAGTLTMLDHAYGFFAIREGGRFAPEGEDVGAAVPLADKPGRKTVVLRKGEYTLDGKPRTDQELTDALKRSVAAEPATWVLLQVAPSETFAEINRAFEVVGAAGVASIRLAPADAGP